MKSLMKTLLVSNKMVQYDLAKAYTKKEIKKLFSKKLLNLEEC